MVVLFTTVKVVAGKPPIETDIPAVDVKPVPVIVSVCPT
jgi:hypothetical protein